MGTLPLNQVDRPGHPHARLDPLALVALGLTVVACCPAAALFGVVTGLVSYVRIRRSEGTLNGGRLAITCAIVSFVIGVLSWGIGDRFQSVGRASMNSEVRIAMDQFLTGTVDPSAWWVGVDPKALLAFQQTVRARFGPLKIGSVTQTGMALAIKSTAQFRLLLESPTIQTVASVTVDLVTDSGTLLPSVRIRSIEISLPSKPALESDAKPLVFPPTEVSEMPDTLPTE